MRSLRRRAALLVLALAGTTGCLALVDFHPKCDGDSDCQSGICSGGQCVSDCNDNSSCGTAPPAAQCTAANAGSVCGHYACDTSNGTCRTACAFTAQCGSGYVCSSQGNCILPCDSDSQCAPYACNLNTGLCRDYCGTDNDCAANFTCDINLNCT